MKISKDTNRTGTPTYAKSNLRATVPPALEPSRSVVELFSVLRDAEIDLERSHDIGRAAPRL